MKGLFIVFEGIDGSGTSTQAELLKNYWLAQGKKTVLSPEPTAGAIGKLIRQILKDNQIILMKNNSNFDEQMSYLFAADRYYHLYNDQDGVLKLLQNQTNVISTRYYFSSLAYHCHQPQDWEQVKLLNQNFPNPDLVIYMDIPLEAALLRLEKRSEREVYENEEKLIKVKQNYHKIFADYAGLFLQINGSEDKQIIHEKIKRFLEFKFI